jgi:transposase
VRPPGEIRQALAQAAEALVREGGAASWRDMAERAGVGYHVAKVTVNNMVRAGVLQQAGVDKRAHSNRWVRLYEPGLNWATESTGCDLAEVTRSWAAGAGRKS